MALCQFYRALSTLELDKPSQASDSFKDNNPIYASDLPLFGRNKYIGITVNEVMY
jgi:hypothetical protein